MKIHYDPKCEELARWFLEGVTDTMRRPAGPAAVEQLAGAIQLAIEDWLDDYQNGPRPAEEPEDESGQEE